MTAAHKTIHEAFGNCLEQVPVDITPEIADALKQVGVKNSQE